MTNPVNEINRTDEVSLGSASTRGNSNHGQQKKQPRQNEKDLVEISRGARERQAGTKRKSIIDYLKELFRQNS